MAAAFGVFLYLYSGKHIDGKAYSEFGYPINLSNVRSSKNIKFAELYPRTRIEEKVFYVDSAAGLWVATGWWFVLFGGFALFV